MGAYPIAVEIARRELRGGLRGFAVLLLSLALGVAAIAAVATVRLSIQNGLAREGRVLLGGDAEIGLAYRFAADDERAWMEQVSQDLSEVAEFRSIVISPDARGARALTNVKAVDRAYPLVGRVRLSPDLAMPEALAGRGGLPGIVMAPELAERLGVRPGAKVMLGGIPFVFMAQLEQEPDSAGGLFALGPRSIVSLDALRQSPLLQPGSLFEIKYRMLLEPQTDLSALKREAGGKIAGGAMQWRDRRDGAPGVRRFVDRMASFLTLVGLAGLIIGGVGVSSAVRSYLEGKVAVIAMLKTLGASSGLIMRIYMLQVGAMAALGIGIGTVLGIGAPLALNGMITARLPVPVEMRIYPQALLQALAYGTLIALLFMLWPLARSQRIRAAALFRGVTLGRRGWPALRHMIVSAVILLMLLALSARFMDSWRLTLWAFAALIGSFLALLLAGLGVRMIARPALRLPMLRRRTSLRLAIGSLAVPGSDSVAVVLALGLGLSVLATIGQIDTNLRGAITRELPEVAPLFFAIDIQPDQLEGYLSQVRSVNGVGKVVTAPMLRGVITKINGRPAREVAGNHWVVRGDRGVSYAASPPDGTRITAGKWWPEGYQGPPLVSFAQQEADEIGLKLGDTITLNVLGRDITATISSFREVDFSSAGMGFVMVMNPGALAGAPHSNLSTIYAAPGAEATLLARVTDSFPNITMISVRGAIERISRLLQGIGAAITYGALATLATGMVVLVGSAASGARARAYEASVLKVLGGARMMILASFLLRSALMGLAAGLVALLVGALAARSVIVSVMEGSFSFDPISAILIILGGIAMNVAAYAAFSLRALNARPSAELRATE